MARRLMDKCVQDATSNVARQDRDKQDWLNLLFERGGADNQYVIWDNSTNSWVTRGDDPKKGGLPAWMARPVTNIFANKIDGVASLLDQTDPAQTWKPNTDDDDDLATADVAENAIPVLLEELGYETIRPDINRAVCLTDKIALAVYVDNDPKHGTQDVLALQCQNPECAHLYMPADLPEGEATTCPECQGALAEATHPDTGLPIGQPMAVGKICGHLLQSFEFSMPSSARTHRAEDNPWILSHGRLSWEEAVREFPQLKNKTRDKTGWKTSSVQRHFADAMRRLSSPRSAEGQGKGAQKDDGPILYRLWHDPIDDGEFSFPEGLYAVMCAGEMLSCDPLPFHQPTKDGKGRPFKNIITRTFRATPGSQFGKPIADDLVPLQYSRNLLEALLFSILLHHAAPRTWMPLSVTLEKEPSGAPGEIIPYRSTTGEGPVTVGGVNPPEGLYKWIEQIDAKFDELSHLNGVLQGERPEGDPTLGEIQILKEKGESSFHEPILELVRFEKQLSRTLLWIARDAAWSDRLRQVQGDNGQWEITQFNQADLQGNVDVQVNPSTAWPKSQVMRRAALKEAMEAGVFALIGQNPELAAKLLEFYDLTEFVPSMDVDRKQVMRELDRWKAATMPQEIAPPNPVTQSLPFHLLYKRNFLKTEEAEALAQANPPVYQAMLAHVQMIEQTLQQQAAAAAMAQAQASAPPAKPGEQKPDGSALEHAIKSGALKPGEEPEAKGPDGSALEAAIGSGALQPAAAGEAQMQQQQQAQQAALPSIDELTASGVLVPGEGPQV